MTPMLRRYALSALDAAAKQPGLALAAIAALSLAAAYTAEYGFGLLPCELCLWQRPAFYLVFLLGLATRWPPVAARWRWRRALLGLALLALLANAALAGYHSGVEQHWWPGPTHCSDAGDMAHFRDIAALREHILNAPLIRCDKPAIEVLGLTMASANFLLCLLLAGFTGWALCRRNPKGACR